jgi:hypothetical protein
MIELLHYMKMIAMVTTMTNEIKSATSVVTTNESTTVDNKNYDELIREFHRFWDVFPGIARLITKNHRILASNSIAAEKGFVEGAICAQVGTGPNAHRKCKLNKMFADKVGYTDRVLGDRVRGWAPVEGYDDVCVHFTVMIPESED